MPRIGLDKKIILDKVAALANSVGIENITIKMIADECGVKPPSLYNFIKGLDDLKKELMNYGWSAIEERIVASVIGLAGYDAIRAMCYAFYDYATENPGVFDAMLWYNRYKSKENMKATSGLFDVAFKVMKPLGLSDEKINHIVRTCRSMLQGFAMLNNNHSFGHKASVSESFDVSVDILISGIKSQVDK